MQGRNAIGKHLNRYLCKYRQLPLPAKAGLWFTICSIIQRGISVISMPIFTRLMSTDTYGVYNLFTSWHMLFSLIVTLNLASEVFNRGLTEYADDRPSYTSSQACLITILTLAFYSLYLIFHVYVDAFTGMDLLLTSLMFLDIYTTTIVSLWYARKRFDYAYRQLLAVTLGISMTSVAVGILTVWIAPEEWKVVARVVSNTLPSLLVSTCVFAGFIRESCVMHNAKWWNQSIRLAIPLVPHYSSQVLLNQADKIMIGWFLDNTRVAIYGVAHSAGLLLVMVNNGINSSFVPWLYGKLRNRDYNAISGVTNSLTVIVLVLVFLLMLFAPECVRILAPKAYYDAIWCIPPIATCVVFAFQYSLFVNIEIYYGRVNYVAIASIVAALVNVILNYIAIPIFGFVSSAYVTSICYMLTAILHYVFMKKTLDDSHVEARIYDVRFLAFAALGTIACAVLSLALYEMSIVRIAFTSVLLLALFWKRSLFISAIKSMTN